LEEGRRSLKKVREEIPREKKPSGGALKRKSNRERGREKEYGRGRIQTKKARKNMGGGGVNTKSGLLRKKSTKRRPSKTPKKR